MTKPPPSEQDTTGTLDAESSSPPMYGVYGLTLSSNFDFSYPLPPASGPATLDFDCLPNSPEPDFWNRASCVYSTRNRTGKRSGLYRDANTEALRFLNGSADFYLQPGRITCHLWDSSYTYGVEIWLLGTVLAYWMEQQGVPVLHASAVVVDNRAVGFLASNRGGKSTLAAAMMQAGHPLLTDGSTSRRRTGVPSDGSSRLSADAPVAGSGPPLCRRLRILPARRPSPR